MQKFENKVEIKTKSGSTYTLFCENDRYFFSQESNLSKVEFCLEASGEVSVGFPINFVLTNGKDFSTSEVVEIKQKP